MLFYVLVVSDRCNEKALGIGLHLLSILLIFYPTADARYFSAIFFQEKSILGQALAANVKAEVRAALSHHGISKFVIKPVQRQYAFEMATIPRKKQWVLKVKYAATSPQLPLGLTGA